MSFLVCLRSSDDRNIHTGNLGDLVEIDLRENDLLGNAQSIITSAIKTCH